jgi:hypothetical protein
MMTTTTEARPPVSDAARVASERTAWQYVTAMHAAAVGRPRAPIRGIVEDVEDMREQLSRERDVARARVAELERQLAGRKPLSADDREFIAEHISEGLVFSKYAFAHKARVEFETVLARFPDNLEALHGLLDLYRPEGERRVESREQRTKAEIQRLKANAAPPRAETLAEPARTRITLPELLMNEGMITLDQCLETMRHQKQNGGRFSTAFVKLGFLTEKQVIAILARVYGIPSIDLEHVQANPALIEILPAETARKYRVLPLAATTTLTVAVADPGDWLAIDAVASLTGCSVQPVVASDAALDRAIDRCYGPARSPRKAAPPRERGLRLAWSRGDELPGDRAGGPEGDRPAA